MKQNFLLKTMPLLCVLVGGVSNAWAEEKTDILNQTWTGVTGSSYTEKTGLEGSNSDAVYTVQCAGANSSIQLRSNSNNSGVVTTTSGGKVKSITVEWNSNTSAGRILNVYGKNSAYSKASDLYNANNQGDLLGTIIKGTSTTLEVDGDYEYIGFRSASGAMYLTSVSIAWETGGGGSTPSITANDVNIAYDATNGSIEYSLANATGNVTASITSGNWLTLGQITESAVPFTCSANTGVERTAQVTLSFTDADDKIVTVTQAAAPISHTATFSVNGNTTTQDFEEGAAIAFPANPADVSGKTFVGWVTVAIDGTTDDEPSFVTTAQMGQADITYYAVFAEVTPGESTTKTDNLTTSTFGSPGSYTSWSGKSATSDAVYAGNSTTNNSTNIQIRSTSPSGIITTTSGGKVKKVTVSWASNTAAERTLDIYGKNTAYTEAADLYGEAAAQGTLLGSIVYGTSTELTISGDYAYIGLRSNSGAMYLESISIDWYAGTPDTYSAYCTTVVAAAVEKPVITVADNPFLFSTTATITCETEGAAIKYSYDGENWNDYTAALTITATTTIYAKAVKGNDESSVAQATATKNLAEPTVTVTGDLTLDLDGETNVEAGTLTAAVTYNEAAVAGAVVTWTSSNTDVATINATTGAVTIKTTGEVTFTATYAGNSDYSEATGTKTVTVTDSKVPGSVGNPYTVAQALEVINALANNGTIADKYVTGKISQIDSYNSSYKSITYWISDDGTTTSQMQVYSGKGLNGADFSAESDLNVGDVVTVFGELKKYVKNSTTTPEFNSGSEIKARTELPASDLTKTGDIILDFKNGATDADLTDYFTTSSTGAITYTVADKTVIENADELISALKVGITTVIVSQAATLSYKAGEITINVIVQDTRDAATTIPAINISTLKVGNSGTVSVTNPVKADEGVTFSYTSSNEDVLLIDGAEYAALAVGTATVTVTATPSNTNLYKTVVANFEVTVEADVKTNTEITLATSGSTVYGTPKNVDYTITDGYDGELSYIIDNAAIADVELGASSITFTPKAVGTAVITISAPATAAFNAAEDVLYTLTVTAPEGGTTAAILGEETYTFDFSDNTDWAFPTDYTTGENTYTKDGKTITLNAATNGYKFNSNVILFGKEGATLTLPAFDKPVTKISTTGVSSASGKVTQNIFVGETAVSTETTSAKEDHEYEIASEYQAAGTIYTLKVTNANNTQLTDITVHMEGGIAVKLNTAGYATFCSQYPLDFSAAEGYTAWQIKSISGETITFEKITDKIKGGQGILLKGEAGATVTLASADSDDELSENLLFGTTAPTYAAADTYYGLSGNKFVKVNAGTIPAGKALLPASEIPSTARELTFVFDEGNTTGIKAIDNSQLTIDNYYDLQGRKVVQPAKGLYIKNGKKVVLK